jgi:hypothetical protein
VGGGPGVGVGVQAHFDFLIMVSRTFLSAPPPLGGWEFTAAVRTLSCAPSSSSWGHLPLQGWGGVRVRVGWGGGGGLRKRVCVCVGGGAGIQREDTNCRA